MTTKEQQNSGIQVSKGERPWKVGLVGHTGNRKGGGPSLTLPIYPTLHTQETHTPGESPDYFYCFFVQVWFLQLPWCKEDSKESACNSEALGSIPRSVSPDFLSSLQPELQSVLIPFSSSNSPTSPLLWIFGSIFPLPGNSPLSFID